jgi:proteasome lid subunit RPN8/RPN11
MDQFGQWHAEGLPVRIEYSLAVMEELRVYGEEGFQKIPHGGIEVGALLLGERSGGAIRIMEWRPIACDHARGPGFTLSPADRQGLGELIARCGKAPELKGLSVVGWFHTHTRSRIFLSADDLTIYNDFFPEPGQIALVMRPQKDMPPTAGFFCKDDAGNLNAEASAAEFVLKPDPGQSLKPRRATAAGAGSGRVMTGRPEGLSRPAETMSRHERPMFRPIGHPRIPAETPAQADLPAEPALPPMPPASAGRFQAKWAVLALFVLTAAATAFHLWRTSQTAQAASLKIEEVDQSLLISWDHSSPAIAQADRAVLRIVDGTTVRSVPLSMTAVRSGAVTYMRQADDVEVRLTLFRNNQPGAQSFAHYVGASPAAPQTATANPATAPAPNRQRLQLQSDVTRLREQLKVESDRAERLREELVLLEKTSNGAR